MSDMGIGEALLLSTIVGGGASVAGGALANKGSQTSSTTPTMDPAYGPLQKQVLDLVQKRLSGSTDLSGYTAGGLAGINKSYGAGKASSDNDLSARGLATSPVAGVVDANNNNARAGSSAGFLNSIPLLQRQLHGDDLSSAASIMGLGRGQTSTGTQSGGGGAAGAFTNLAGYLGYLQGKGAFAKPGATPAPVGNGLPNWSPQPF